MYPDSDSYIPVPTLAQKDADDILKCWLKDSRRSLTSQQKTILMTAFQSYPLPLFLKLSFDEAKTWSSFWTSDSTRLEKTVKASIDRLFSQLETKHGPMFVSKALGYLTICKSILAYMKIIMNKKIVSVSNPKQYRKEKNSQAYTCSIW